MGDEKVMDFIHRFITLFGRLTPTESSILGTVFSQGFCYYFAIILKEAFGCGDICITSDCCHVVWVYKNIAYDVGGVHSKYPRSANIGNFFNGNLIPISMVPHYMDSYKHVLLGTTQKGMSEIKNVLKIIDNIKEETK
jgi:hypothetical protein